MTVQEISDLLSKDMIQKAEFYPYNNLPATISYALYSFGNSDIKEIAGFYDASSDKDGSKGMIITPQAIYYSMKDTVSFKYSDITAIEVEKHRNQVNAKVTIRTTDKNYIYHVGRINGELFAQFLNEVTGIEIQNIMTIYEKVAYYVPIVLFDIENDAYEDLELDKAQWQQVSDFKDNLNAINELDDTNYEYELDLLLPRALQFFDDLGLDSDEIDILNEVSEEFEKIHAKDDEQINKAQEFVDNMMNEYKNGNPELYNNIMNIMSSMGYDEESLKDKSPAEMMQIADELCERFGVSKAQMAKMAERFMNKHQ